MSAPSIFVDAQSSLYILVSNVNKRLNDFIITGKTESHVFHVLPEDQEHSMIQQWNQLGFNVTYHNQQFEYMGITASISYPKIKNPDSDVSVSLLPWFMLMRRRYLIFVYAYAFWHYQDTRKKSLKESAKAAGKLFKAQSLNKSTVYRSINSMADLIDISRMGQCPEHCGENAKGHAQESCIDIAELTSQILTNCPSMESLKKTYGGMIKQLVGPVSPNVQKGSVPKYFTDEHFAIITKQGAAANKKPKDTRRRPPRRRGKSSKHAQRPALRFIDFSQCERIRKEFI